MRTLILVLLLLLSQKSFAQSIPNGNFDSLCICAIDRVWQWVTSDIYQISNDTIQPLLPDHHYDGSLGDLHFAIQSVQINYTNADTARQMKSVMLMTQPSIRYLSGAPYRGFLINGDEFYTNSAGEIDLIRGGTPFSQKPTHIRGYYKFENMASAQFDYGKVIAILKKYNSVLNSYDTIAIAESNQELSETQVWTQFQIPFVYQSADAPDSIVVAIYSATTGVAATTLWVDDISFFTSNSIDELNIPNPYFFYPNPAHDLIRFSKNDHQSRKYSVFSIRGALLMHGEMINEVNISSLNPGIYFIKLEEDDKFDFYKIIKI